ncbi:MAG: lysophospholipid acyltransferase family protein [Pseudomonadota bacterium]|nr:lysophospholipid acyltransferase family protein [Pseudomonadota bacterium]
MNWASSIRSSLKLATLLLLLGYALLLGVFLVIGSKLVAPNRARQARQALTAHWFAGLARVLSLRITVHGAPSDTPALIVANHISWLDIVALNSVLPLRFIAKAEVANWPLIGWLARQCETLFLRRGQGTSSKQLCDDIVVSLQNGDRVVLFPEGTTSNGVRPRRFHPRLFQAALNTDRPVQPVAIRYPDRDGDGRGMNPLAPFVDEDTLLRHLLALLKAESLCIELFFMAPITATGTRTALCQATANAIRAAIDHAESGVKCPEITPENPACPST